MTSPSSQKLDLLLDEQVKILSANLKPYTVTHYRYCANEFLRYLRLNHPEVETPAQLQRNPHIRGWLQSLSKSFTIGTRMQIVAVVRRLLKALADNGHPVCPKLILRQDITRPHAPKQAKPVCPKSEVDVPFAHIISRQAHSLSATLRPGTVAHYRSDVNGFVRHLHQNYPELHTPAQIRRNPHILSWLRSLAQKNPPLANASRIQAIICVRRLLNDLADNGYGVAENLILPQDFPPKDLYLPKPVSPEVDALLDRELRKTDDLLSNALLLIRATGMRVGECVHLAKDCLHHLGGGDWALHVPLGKLHNERLVPLDQEARKVLDRIFAIVGTSASKDPAAPLMMLKGRTVSAARIRAALKEASLRADCQPVRTHQLRHTYATTMLRAGISLPALKQILGHRDINMTMRYVQITQTDLQHEYFKARQKMDNLHAVPQRRTGEATPQGANAIAGICIALDEVRHQLEMYRRQLADSSSGRRLEPLLRRLVRLRKSLATFPER